MYIERKKMLHRSEEAHVHIILNMATYRGLDKTMAAHDERGAATSQLLFIVPANWSSSTEHRAEEI